MEAEHADWGSGVSEPQELVIVVGARHPRTRGQPKRCGNCGAWLQADGWAKPGTGQIECCRRIKQTKENGDG